MPRAGVATIDSICGIAHRCGGQDRCLYFAHVLCGEVIADSRQHGRAPVQDLDRRRRTPGGLAHRGRPMGSPTRTARPALMAPASAGPCGANSTTTVDPMLNQPSSAPRSSAMIGSRHGQVARLAWPFAPDPPGPGEAHAADEERADQHDGERPGRRVEDAGNALVAREQARHAVRRRRIDAEQVAGDESREAQRPGQRHVHAVVVVGREVDGHEVTAREFRRQRGVAAEQGRGRVVDALGLQQRVARDAAGLAHRAIGRAERRRCFRVETACAGAQPAGEEVVEARVAVRGRAAPLPRGRPGSATGTRESGPRARNRSATRRSSRRSGTAGAAGAGTASR